MTQRLKRIVGLIAFLAIAQSANAAITDQDWMNYLDGSCSTTMSGKAKRLFGEKSFWVHVSVSMDSWAEIMSRESPQQNCAIDYQTSRNQEQYMKCMAYFKEKWEWYARCKPIVTQMCRNAGGYC